VAEPGIEMSRGEQTKSKFFWTQELVYSTKYTDTKGDEEAAGADGGSGGDGDEVGNRFGVWSRSGLDREALRRLF
jgi:hypothetical protein